MNYVSQLSNPRESLVKKTIAIEDFNTPKIVETVETIEHVEPERVITTHLNEVPRTSSFGRASSHWKGLSHKANIVKTVIIGLDGVRREVDADHEHIPNRLHPSTVIRDDHHHLNTSSRIVTDDHHHHNTSRVSRIIKDDLRGRVSRVIRADDHHHLNPSTIVRDDHHRLNTSTSRGRISVVHGGDHHLNNSRGRISVIKGGDHHHLNTSRGRISTVIQDDLRGRVSSAIRGDNHHHHASPRVSRVIRAGDHHHSPRVTRVVDGGHTYNH